MWMSLYLQQHNPVILSQNLILDFFRHLKNPQISNYKKIRPLRKNLLNADRQTDREMNKQDESAGRFLLILLKIINIFWKSKKIIEIINFWQADLVSGQNTYTHSPLADTPAFYSDGQELNFHA